MVTQGDIVIIDFDPALGSEQQGRRPGVVVSNDTYHKNTNGFAIVVPITTDRSNHFPLHVPLDERTKTVGEIMCEQLKTMDLKTRSLHRVESIPADVLDKVLKIVKLLF
jgi:mRNA interferase MazF